MLMKHFEVEIFKGIGFKSDLHREVKNGSLSRGDVGFAMVDRDLVGQKRLFLKNSQ